MNAPVTLSLPSTSRPRADGWTPDRRRLFLEAVAAGYCVEAACAHVGLSKVSVYALRHRDPGFALGWSGASLRARDALADALTSRALNGQVETWTLPDGTEGSRRRYDTRLALGLLARLDKLAEQQENTYNIEQPDDEAARCVAHDLGGFLDLIEQGEADPTTVDTFVDANIRKLRKLRSEARLRNIERGEGAVVETRASDDDRARAVAEQLGEPEARRLDGNQDEQGAQGVQTLAEPRGNADRGAATEEIWATRSPPPAGFSGYESGTFGQPDYWRTLTPAEHVASVADKRAASVAPENPPPPPAAEEEASPQPCAEDEHGAPEMSVPVRPLSAGYRRRLGIS
jgi:hypothetical protein